MLNQKIGRYEIKEVLGEGAMAVVYRAYDPEINRSVACKVLKESLCVDDEYTSRFLRESKAAGALSHPSIVTIYDVGKVQGVPYIMMELIEGKDLGEALKEHQKFSQKDTLKIALRLAKALDYAHAANVVHRDIKPDNIILMSDNETVKVADFGIARVGESDETQQTQVGTLLGTPRYMSPEQALGETIDGRSDLFSVGAIMYEMLTGQKAFDADNMSSLMMQIAQKQPPPLKTIAPEVSVGVRQIIQKLLQKSPDKRYQDGGSLAAAIVSELGEFTEQQEEQRKHRFIPLRYKWTLSAVVLVSLVLAISMKLMFMVQASVMTQQAVDGGAAFAKFIAAETVPTLRTEDWATLRELTKDAVGRGSLTYLIVTDSSGIIRASNNDLLIDQPYSEDPNAVWISRTEDVYTTSSHQAGETGLFNLETPVLFQDEEIGKVILGVSQKNLDKLKEITAVFMMVLGGLVTIVVATVMFVLGGGVTKPLRSLTKIIQKFEHGDFDARISLKRKDELGKVFNAFNDMASAVQSRFSEAKDELIYAETKLTEWRINAMTKPAQATTYQTIDEPIVGPQQGVTEEVNASDSQGFEDCTDATLLQAPAKQS